MTNLEKTLHIEFGQLIDKMNNGLIHPHTTRMKLVEKAMETFALYNAVGRSEQLSCGRNITTCLFYKEGGKCSNDEYCRDQTT